MFRMKKLFFFAMLAVAALAVSCNKDDDTEVSGDLVGVWTMNVESTHYFKVGFDAKGKFDWQVLGVSERRETGKYTLDGKVAVLKTEKHYDRWDDNAGVEYKDRWFEKSGMENETRTLTITDVKPGVLCFYMKDDPMFGDMLGKVILFLEDIDQKISTSDLAGTWIYKDESGTELARYNFSGNSYSRLVKSDHSNHVTIWEDSGTWSYSKGKITFSGCEYPELASLRAYLDGDTLYVANLLEWDFYSAAYECIKTKNQ